MSEQQDEYRLTGRHVETLASGRQLAPGETTTDVRLKPEEDDPTGATDQRLIDEGKLLKLHEGEKAEVQATPAAQEAAAEEGVALTEVGRGSGKGGKVTKKDVTDAAGDDENQGDS